VQEAPALGALPVLVLGALPVLVLAAPLVLVLAAPLVLVLAAPLVLVLAAPLVQRWAVPAALPAPAESGRNLAFDWQVSVACQSFRGSEQLRRMLEVRHEDFALVEWARSCYLICRNLLRW